MDKIYHHALKLLKRRDYSVLDMRNRLGEVFGEVPEDVISELRHRGYLDDVRFATNVVLKRRDGHSARAREELERAGVDDQIIRDAITAADWPSLRDALKARMTDRRLNPPLQKREAARLFRALSRLGYAEDEIREELEQLHEEQ